VRPMASAQSNPRLRLLMPFNGLTMIGRARDGNRTFDFIHRQQRSLRIFTLLMGEIGTYFCFRFYLI